MIKKTKYTGITPGTNGERAIDIVMQAKSITGPNLAARLGISVYEMGCLRRAVDLGYIQKKRSTENGTMNIYTPGENMAAQMPEPCRSMAPTIPEDDDAAEKPNLVPPRTPSEFRPLNLAKLGVKPQREGAWDFKKIPSRYFDAEAESEA